MAKIFISHAFEDKDIAKPLADILVKRGHQVWYDDYVLNVGDSLRESIDLGLNECDYGVVILSKNFFSKNWTKKELNGLLAKETKDNRNYILPILHGISHVDVVEFSPILADRISLMSNQDLFTLIERIEKVTGIVVKKVKDIINIDTKIENIVESSTLLKTVSDDSSDSLKLKYYVNEFETNFKKIVTLEGEYSQYDALEKIGELNNCLEFITIYSNKEHLINVSKLSEVTCIFLKFLKDYRIDILDSEIQDIIKYIIYIYKRLLTGNKPEEFSILILYLSNPSRIFGDSQESESNVHKSEDSESVNKLYIEFENKFYGNIELLINNLEYLKQEIEDKVVINFLDNSTFNRIEQLTAISYELLGLCKQLSFNLISDIFLVMNLYFNNIIKKPSIIEITKIDLFKSLVLTVNNLVKGENYMNNGEDIEKLESLKKDLKIG